MNSMTPINDYYQFKQKAKNIFNRQREDREKDFSPAIRKRKGEVDYPLKNLHSSLEQNTL